MLSLLLLLSAWVDVVCFAVVPLGGGAVVVVVIVVVVVVVRQRLASKYYTYKLVASHGLLCLLLLVIGHDCDKNC